MAAYSKSPGIFAYKPKDDIANSWHKYTIMTGVFTEALAVGDLNGDGKLEIVSRPDWYTCPPNGPFSGPWFRKTYAPNFREMCRVAMVDITGSGRPDIVVCESEYLDGKMSWFENRIIEEPDHPWIEHFMEDKLIYAHTLQA